MHVLVVEDDRRMVAVLRQALEEEGHSVTAAFNGREGLAYVQENSFDVVVLDVMIPELSGFDVLKQLRAARNQTPVLMLTAKDAPSDIVSGLDLGADDYLTKPFSLEVLLARVRAVARRGPVSKPVVLEVGDLCMDVSAHQVRRGNRAIELTRTEFMILELLMRAAGRVVTREALMEEVWISGDVSSNTLDVFMRLLRSKLEQAGEAKLIRTVRGLGYTIGGTP